MNPYDAPNHTTAKNRSFSLWHHVLAASPSLLPLLTLTIVAAVVLLERDFNVRGAILGSTETPMGVLFTMSAFMTFASIGWMPVGLVLSILLSFRLPRLIHRIAYPTAFGAACVACIGFVVLDPDGMWTYYMD
ncbi:MAG: hypothetical protein WBD31_31020 [Rubripirellula sp.]